MRGAVTTGNVWLASYPKSGNTWLRLALTSLLNGGATVDINKSARTVGMISADRGAFDRMLDVDSSDLGMEETMRLQPWQFTMWAQTQGQSFIWKTHDAWTRTKEGMALFSPQATRASVYIVRDPRDVAISFAHHFDRSIDVAIATLANPKFGFARNKDRLPQQLPQTLLSWSQHVESWLDEADPKPLVVRYEDMVADFPRELTKIARDTGLPSDSASIAGAVAATEFRTLKKQEEQKGFRQRNSRTNPFFRRGVAGGWRDTLTSVQVERIEREHGRVMRRLGYWGAPAKAAAAV